MLTVTEPAAAYLSQLLEKAPEEAVVRFVPQQNGLGLEFGTEMPGDTTFNHDEKTVLALDTSVAKALNDRTLDVQSTEQEVQLKLT